MSFLATNAPSFIDAPLPNFVLVITVAPAFMASSTVWSNDLSSTTITSVTFLDCLTNATTWATVFSSFNAGIITVIMVR